VCLEGKDSEISLFICLTGNLGLVPARAGLWPHARRAVADPSPSTGEREEHLPPSAGW